MTIEKLFRRTGNWGLNQVVAGDTVADARKALLDMIDYVAFGLDPEDRGGAEVLDSLRVKVSKLSIGDEITIPDVSADGYLADEGDTYRIK